MMRRHKLCGMLVVVALLALPGLTFADTVTISLASFGTAADAKQTNSMGDAVQVAPNASWAAALPGSSWVSYASTGDTSAAGFFVVPNNTSMDFYNTFTLAGTPTGATLTVTQSVNLSKCFRESEEFKVSARSQDNISKAQRLWVEER